ncbi:MAG: elongation factor Ts, partial [Phycisphaera sp.]
MAKISAKDVMALRNRTGLPMMACKKALTETDGDIDAAENQLRKTLKGKMEGRTDRV